MIRGTDRLVIAQEMIATRCLFSDAVDYFSFSEDIA
jgi:hypothetical protein